MRSVVHPPAVDHDLRLLECVEDLAIEAFIQLWLPSRSAVRWQIPVAPVSVGAMVLWSNRTATRPGRRMQ
jgi:hypothetical protein